MHTSQASSLPAIFTSLPGIFLCEPILVSVTSAAQVHAWPPLRPDVQLGRLREAQQNAWVTVPRSSLHSAPGAGHANCMASCPLHRSARVMVCVKHSAPVGCCGIIPGMGFQVKFCLPDNSVISSKHSISQLLVDCDREL